MAGGAAAQLADLRARPAWRDLDAVEQGHVVDVSDEAIRPSPGLVDAIEQLAREAASGGIFREQRDAGRTKLNPNRRGASLAAARTADRCAECAR